MKHSGEELGNRFRVRENTGREVFQRDIDVELSESLDVLDRTFDDVLEVTNDGGQDLRGHNLNGLEVG